MIFFILVKTKTEKKIHANTFWLKLKTKTLNCVSVCCLLANQFSLKSDQKCIKVNTITINLKEKCKTFVISAYLTLVVGPEDGDRKIAYFKQFQSVSQILS